MTKNRVLVTLLGLFTSAACMNKGVDKQVHDPLGLVEVAYSLRDLSLAAASPARKLAVPVENMKQADRAIAEHIASMPEFLEKVSWSPTKLHGKMFYRLEDVQERRQNR